jgi:predicted ATP-grasp superfamily ATP-dependent carboligase
LSGQSRAQPDGEGGCGCGAEVDVAALVIAGGDGPVLFQAVDRSFDGIAFLVAVLVEAGWPSAA